jgi:AcrR family transcriptional regulator
MNKKPGTPKRIAVLHAARHIVQAQGAVNLTLDAVAQAAGVSKGGLLYHFPSKEALIEGMIAAYLEEFDALLQDALANDPTPDAPGRWLRAFVRASFAQAPVESGVALAGFAALANDPLLLQRLRTAYDSWKQQAVADGVSPETALLVILATDGMVYGQLLGVQLMSDAERTAMVDRLIDMIGSA